MVNFEELIKSLILPLVSFPDEVEIAYIGEEDGVESYEVKVAKFDLGRVIGKGGHIAQAIRTILYAKASKEGVRVHLNIIEK
jgi:predicted RNA-binding protein YlqC (UPF0109 family)